MSSKHAAIVFSVFSALGSACGPDTVYVRTAQLSPTEVPPIANVGQYEPSAAAFGGSNPSGWVSCYIDGTRQNAQSPLRSRITCSIWDTTKQAVQVLPILGEAPFASSAPEPYADPWVFADPVNTNRIILVSMMRWQTINGTARSSLGLTILERTTAGQPVRQRALMRPITGNGIEGPDGERAATAADVFSDRPSLACDPAPDVQNGVRCYLAFVQYRNNQVMVGNNRFEGRLQSRVVVSSRDPAMEIHQGWSPPVPVTLAGVSADSGGWINIDRIRELRQLRAPLVVVNRQTRAPAVAVGFLDDTEIGSVGNYYVGVSADRATSTWTVHPVTNPVSSTDFTVRQAHDRSVFQPPWSSTDAIFKAFVVPALAFDEATNEWVLAFTSMAPNFIIPTGSGAVIRQFSRSTLYVTRSASATAGTWSVPLEVSNPAPLGIVDGRPVARDVVFPTLAFDRSNARLTLAWMESADVDNQTWTPTLRQSADGGNSWGLFQPLETTSLKTSPSVTFVGDYTSVISQGGRVFYTWPAIRPTLGNEPLSPNTDVFGAELQFP